MHVTEIIKQEQASDEAIAVTIRCCSNPKTDSTITIYGVHGMSHEQIEEMVSKHHDRVASKCHGMGKATDHLQILATKTKVHEVL